MGFLFNKFAELLIKGQADLLNWDIRLILLTAVPLQTMENLTGIQEYAGQGYERKILQNKNITGGVLSASNLVYYLSGEVITGAMIYKHVTNDADSVPIAFTSRGFPAQVSNFGRYELDVQYLLKIINSKEQQTIDILSSTTTNDTKIINLKTLYGVV